MVRTLQEATDVLLSYAVFAKQKTYTLDVMRELLAALGNPQENLRIIHIAGTSGKTSTAYFIRGLLQAAGKKTGLTISPHITAINERVQINGEPLPEAAFVAYLNEFLPLVERTKLQPSYFEIIIAFAFWVFAKEKVDYAVIETGLGGLLDATNTVQRTDKLCVLTNIGLDHTEILGDTVAEIAAQKAGIIQQGNVVVTTPQPKKVMAVFTAVAQQRHATLTTAKTIHNSLLPPFQVRNWSLALAAYAKLGLPALTPAQLATAATQTPPGRMEIYTYKNKTIILDGAHNGQKIEALHQALQARGIQKAAVLANLKTAPQSKIVDSLAALKPFTAHLIVPEFIIGQDFHNLHSVPAQEFADLARHASIHSVQTEANTATALQKLLARPEDVLIITGSLYLIALTRPEILKIALSGIARSLE